MAGILFYDIFKLISFYTNHYIFMFHWFFSQWSNQQYAGIGLGNGLVQNRQQAIILTSNGTGIIHWCIKMSKTIAYIIDFLG